jgi:hypothetical protein
MKKYVGVVERPGRKFVLVDVDGMATALPRVFRHSPDGFEWGYGGSGPADLALSILVDAVGKEKAERHYQRFTWDFVALWGQAGFEITEADVKVYVETWELMK